MFQQQGPDQRVNHEFMSVAAAPRSFLRLRNIASSRSRRILRLPCITTSMSPPHERLSTIHRHLTTNSTVPLRTPFSVERESRPTDDIPWEPIEKQPYLPTHQKRAFSQQTSVSLEEEGKRDHNLLSANKSAKMSTQPSHPALLIPGPIEFDDDVLASMSHYSESHVGQPFVNCFGETLSMLRQLFQSTDPAAQPFVISGSGTLGWDQVAANLAEAGDEVLVLHTGYFADSFADCFETYGVKATQLKAAIGDRPQLDEVEKALGEKKYKLLTVTHTDTSTGVLSHIQPLAELVQRVSPETLLVVDGVCSIGCEDLQFDAWGVDVALTASQKAIGCPAGLSIVMASGRAIETFKARKTRPTSYFASWKNWLPIMQNYEAKKPSYFATPSPQLIHALHTSLKQILSRPLSERFERHRKVSEEIKAEVANLGLKQLASKPENQANGMTAIYLPEGMAPPDILPTLMKKGVIFAGGLHKEIAAKYIRFGHMGVSVMDDKRDDVKTALKALKEGLSEVQGKK